MPYAENRGVRIHYEVEGEGPTLVLQHGFTQNLQRWYQCGYVDALKGHYRVVLIDARGHGKSDKPHDRAAYTWPVGVTDVFAVLNAISAHQAIFWGYSMGGAIGLGAVTVAPDRITALIVGGASGGGSNTGTQLQHVDGSDPEAFVAAFETHMNARMTPEYRTILLASDTQALAAAAQDRPSLGDQLPEVTTPCLIYAGDQDPVFSGAQETAMQIPGAKFVAIPGASHPVAFTRSDMVLPVVRKFLEGVAKEHRPNSGMEPTR